LDKFGDFGRLLKTFLYQSNVSDADSAEIEFWHEEFNQRYVDVVEMRLHEALSSYKRANDGGFGRRTGNK
jgi:hypothetical protein